MTTTISLEDYFAQSNTPQTKSPVGTLMLRVIEKYPELGFDDARAKARELLAVSAKSRMYRTPRVFSASEITDRAERFKKAFPKSAAAACGQPP